MSSKTEIFETLMRSGQYTADEAANLADELAGSMKDSRLNRLTSFLGDRTVPDTTEIATQSGRVAMDQPSRITRGLGDTVVGLGKWGAIGATGVVGAPAAAGMVNKYFSRQTAQEISQNEETQLEALKQVLSDTSLSFKEKRSLIKAIKGVGERNAGDSGNGLFSLQLPLLGKVSVSPAMVGLGLLVLVILLQMNNGPGTIPVVGNVGSSGGGN